MLSVLKKAVLGRCIIWMCLVWVLLLLIRSPSVTADFVTRGLELCYRSLIPAIFPFAVLGALLCSAEAPDFMTGFISRLFGVGKAGAVAVISGYLSGFPVGAVCVCRMYKQGRMTKSEAEKLICYVNNPSAPFVIGVVGRGLLKSTGAGVFIYVILISVSVIVGVALRSYGKALPAKSIVMADECENCFSFSQAVKDSALSMVGICGTVVIFSVISGYFSMLPLPFGETFNALLCGFLEISNGISCLSLSALSPSAKFVLAGVICAFSGLSVHVQIASELRKSDIGMKLFFLFRVISTLAVALISALFSFLGASL